jgi:ribosomal protein L11 methylase PrmA
MTSRANSGSFRDLSGFLFWQDGSLYRQVNTTYKENYQHLMKSGLYEALTTDGLLVPHEEVDIEFPQPDLAYNVIRPELIPFISYPYEWCFSQLKDAALTTLRIQKVCLNFGMSLKDCSAYNIQFRKGSPVLIDTLSFEKYREGQPWVAYRQFCQHFLAPLALTSHRDTRLSQLLRIYMDGIPLDLASSLLPSNTYLMFSLLSHIHLHARSQRRFASKPVDTTRYKVSRLSLLGIIDSLESAIRKQKWRPHGISGADYYRDTNYSSDAFEHKKQIVAEFIDKIDPGSVWDLGANVGVFSRIAGDRGIPTVSFDIDSAAVESNYLECIRGKETNILPLVLDLTNPSPGIGWGNEERLSFAERGPTDSVLALALVHHLVISNNVPFNRIAEFLSRICRSLIIEFIPKSDSQVQRLLATRDDVFPDYTQQCFEDEFKRYFKIESSVGIRDSQRTLYLMRKS